MISRWVDVTSVAKVNKKLLVIRFCIATRAPGFESLPPQIFPTLSGRKVDGMLGQDLLKEFKVVQIDFKHRRLVLSH
jgi:hypothetical protein